MEMINAIGRRKSAVARVYLTEGTGKITINKVELAKYFPSAILQYVIKQPLLLLGAEEKYDIKCNPPIQQSGWHPMPHLPGTPC